MDWNMGQLMDVATGYWRSCVLSAAVELNLFDHIGPDGSDAETLARKTGSSTHHLAELLDALSALGVLVKIGDRYGFAPGAEALLSRRSDTCMLDALRFNANLYPLWGQLANAVREGSPVVPPGAHLGHDPERTRSFVMGMHSRALGMAPLLLPALDMTGVKNLLDVAAGPGTFSRMLAERHDPLHVTQFDLPAVLAVAESLAAQSSAQSRIQFVPGDYHGDELPDGFDAALLCGAIHQEDKSSAAEILRKIRRALKPGGRLMLVDMMLEENRVGPLFSNLFSINMMLTSPNGRVFSAAQLTRIVQEAGFSGAACRPIPPSPYWIITASS